MTDQPPAQEPPAEPSAVPEATPQPASPSAPDAANPTSTAPPGSVSPTIRPTLVRSNRIAEPLRDVQSLRDMELIRDPGDPIPVIVELNLRHEQGLRAAAEQFGRIYALIMPDQSRPKPVMIASTYVHCWLTLDELQQLLAADDDAAGPDDAGSGVAKRRRAIFRVWPDFPVRPLVDHSVATIKADAAHRAYAATGHGVTWAVIDSGIDQRHPHFQTYRNLADEVEHLHKDFTQPIAVSADSSAPALTDGYGHGTHVAGIIAGVAPEGAKLHIVEHAVDETGSEEVEERQLAAGAQLAGISPMCKLVSLKVFDDHGRGSSSNVLRALAYVWEELNGYGKLTRVQGVNLSLGYEFDPKWFACGQSPLCVEVNRLVRSGVVVVVAAGNTGYGMQSARERTTDTGLELTINDPGNADLAITVGSTHRDQPHTYGVSYFSSKGPTGDGRLKPDLVAPGERITSCAAGPRLTAMNDEPGSPSYIDDNGTSMAAPHVSGAIAAFLSIRGEYVGQPEEVKRIFLESATPLGRDRYFEGHGLVDLMRAIQSV